jgi:hypothetical protein
VASVQLLVSTRSNLDVRVGATAGEDEVQGAVARHVERRPKRWRHQSFGATIVVGTILTLRVCSAYR